MHGIFMKRSYNLVLTFTFALLINQIILAIFCQYFQCVEKYQRDQNVYLLELKLASPYQNIQAFNFACCCVWV
jgi:hypothetical protein